MFLVKVTTLIQGILCQSIFNVRVSSRGDCRAKFWHQKTKNPRSGAARAILYSQIDVLLNALWHSFYRSIASRCNFTSWDLLLEGHSVLHLLIDQCIF